MSAREAVRHGTALRGVVNVGIGKARLPVGQLVYVKQGQRQNTAFAYDPSWLARTDRFAVSPDLELVPDHQRRKAPSPQDSVFPHAIADTAPDAWGRRVIGRDHAKRRVVENLPPLSELDYLLAVDDFSRVGALRLHVAGQPDLPLAADGRRRTPPLVDLQAIYNASRAVENNQETAADLRYLQGRGTSLGGLRPKCTVIDRNGQLSLGKFPSVGDERSVTRAEVLALHLARRAGIDAATSRIELLGTTPVGIIARFDRTAGDGRIPYLSASSILQASRAGDPSYFELADAIRAHGYDPIADVRQLWRRLVFNLLITNVDDHLHNMGLLHVAHGLWRLAPAFDLNPFPDKHNESKTWLSERDGPITGIAQLLARARYFSLDFDQACAALAEVVAAVDAWRSVAASAAVGLTTADIGQLAQAFEHGQTRDARAIAQRGLH